MPSKVKYPDDYIREKRSIIAAAELTHVCQSEPGWFSVITGEDEYVLPDLDDAFHLAASHILGSGPLNSVKFIQCSDDVWRPDIRVLRRELGEARRNSRK